MTPLAGQADFLRFLYGLALGLGALGALVLRGRERTLGRWGWWAGFGVCHALHEWVELVPGFGPRGEILSSLLWLGSWAGLAGFGVPRGRAGLWGGAVAVGVSLGWVVARLGGGPPEAVWTYTVAFPVAAAAAVRTARAWSRGEVPTGAGILAVGLAGYAVTSGMVGPAAPWAPAAHWNVGAFERWFGVPVWAVRGGAAAWMLLGIHRLGWEQGRRPRENLPPALAAAVALVSAVGLGWAGTELLGRSADKAARLAATERARAWAAAVAAGARAWRAQARVLAVRPDVRAALVYGGDPGLDPEGAWALFDPSGRRLAGGSWSGETPLRRRLWVRGDRLCAWEPVVDPFGGVAGWIGGCTVLPEGDYRLRHLDDAAAAGSVPLLDRRVEVSADPEARRRARGLGMALTLAVIVGIGSAYVAEERRRVRDDERARSDRRLKAVLEAAPDAVFLVEPAERRIVWANERALELVGGSSADDAKRFDELWGGRGRRVWDLASRDGGTAELGSPASPRWFDVTGAAATLGAQGVRLVVLRDVTERTLRYREATEAANVLETVFEAVDEGVVVCDAAHRIRYHNRRYRDIWGVPEDVLWPAPRLEEMVRWACREGIYDPEEEEALVRRRAEALDRAARGERVDLVTPRRDGRVVESAAVGLPDGRILVTFRDVTGRERLVARLQRERERLRGVLEALPVPVYIRGEHGLVEYANGAMVERCGRDPAGEPCHQAVHGLPEACPWCRDPGEEGWSGEWRSPRDGRQYRVRLVRLDGERGRRWLGVLQDVTLERTASERLRAEKEFAENLIEALGVGAFVLDRDGSVLVWNRALEELTGVPAEKVVGTRNAWYPFYASPRPTLADLVRLGRPDRCREFYEDWGPSPLSPRGVRIRRWFRNLNGRDRFLVVDAVPIRDGSGRVRAVVETLQDLTDLQRLEESRTQLVAAVEQATEGIAVLGPDGAVREANPAFRRLVGGGEGMLALLGDLPEAPVRLRRRVGSPGHPGREAELDISAAPLRGGGAVVVLSDVTQEVELERQLRRAQKLEALGTLASGIAHDFNNILTAMIGYLELALDEASPSVRRSLEHVMGAAERAAGLVARMLTFGREAEGDPRPLRLIPVLEEALGLLRASVGPEVELRTVWDVEDDRVVADPVQMHQVMVNLVTNAAHALGPGGGVVEVALRETWVREPLQAVSGSLPPGRYLRLTVSDTGPGIPAEVMDRIFDPFFTTKDVGEGTGLGLSVVHGIVTGGGGAIDVHTSEGQGTTFHVFLPAAGGEVPCKPASPEGRGQRVLVVDDDPAVAEILADVLRGAGYRPVVCQTPGEGLAAFLEDPGSFARIVTDQAMPEMDGLELIARIRKVRPDVPAVLCTGFERETTRRRAMELGGVQVILKPLTATDLLRALHHGGGEEARTNAQTGVDRGAGVGSPGGAAGRGGPRVRGA